MAGKYTYALGRRKTSTARVRLTTGSGKVTINGKPSEEYLAASKYLLTRLEKPFTVLELNNKYDVSARVSGGGVVGQVDVTNEAYKSTLKRADLLGRDPREKERKKFGLKGARKQRQFTKR